MLHAGSMCRELELGCTAHPQIDGACDDHPASSGGNDAGELPRPPELGTDGEDASERTQAVPGSSQ